MQQQALSAIVAWVRLERAMDTFNLTLKQTFGITGLQLAILRILAERPALPLAALRKALVMHPATLGQAVDELRVKGLCIVRTNPEDRRARLVALTPEGERLLAEAPLAGPVRLRQVKVAPARLDRLAAALEDAIELFGLTDWAPAEKPGAARRTGPADPDPMAS
jgi:DNA-binding MarR family transcriptional regulator